MKCKKYLFAITMLTLIVLAQHTGIAQEKGIIIVHKSVPTDSMSSSDIQDIYMGRDLLWDNTVKIEPVMLEKKHEITKRFLKQILDMNYSKFRRFWLRKTYSGNKPGPKYLDSIDRMIEFVSQTAGAIGYVAVTDIDKEKLKNCKVIYVDSLPAF